MIRGPRKPPDTTDVYLARLGDRLRILRVALTEDNALRELAETPLMLTIVTLAYQDAPTEGRVVSDSTVARRKQLFDTYIERMFSRRGVSVHYTRDQTVKWLAWLAWGMQQNQTVFFLENLQPVLLRTRRQYQQYWFVDRWLGVLVCVLVDGLVGGLVKGWIGALSFGLVFGLTLGLMVACFGGMPNRYPGASPRLWSQLYDVCIGAGVAILTLGVLGELIFGLSGGMAFGLVFGLIGGLLGSLAGHPSLRVRAVVSVETLRWSWRQVPASVGNGIVIGLVGGLIYALVVVFGYGFAGGLSYLAVYSLIVVVVFGLVGGFSGAALSSTTRPNQGIHRSLWRALSIGLGGGLIITQVYGLVVGPIGSLLGGLVGGLSLAFAYGGYAVLSHLALRFVLWRSGSIPWNYVRFLDNCADRIFLRKVGGGYIFIHRLLMEYFAELDTTAIEETQKEAT